MSKEAVMENAVPQPAAPRRVPTNQPPNLVELVVETRDWFRALERAVAGYNALNLSLLSFQGQIPEGERKKGLPIFKFTATLDGKNPEEIVADLKYVNPEYIGHVLVPMIMAQASCMLDATDEIEEHLKLIKAALAPIAHNLTNQAAADAA